MFVFQYICIVSEFRGNAKYQDFGSCLMRLVLKGTNHRGSGSMPTILQCPYS
jgi:hypothetical protein